MKNALIPKVNMLKNSSTLAVSVPINLSIKLGFVSLNDHRETYFVEARVVADTTVYAKSLQSAARGLPAALGRVLYGRGGYFTVYNAL